MRLPRTGQGAVKGKRIPLSPLQTGKFECNQVWPQAAAATLIHSGLCRLPLAPAEHDSTRLLALSHCDPHKQLGWGAEACAGSLTPLGPILYPRDHLCCPGPQGAVPQHSSPQGCQQHTPHTVGAGDRNEGSHEASSLWGLLSPAQARLLRDALTCTNHHFLTPQCHPLLRRVPTLLPSSSCSRGTDMSESEPCLMEPSSISPGLTWASSCGQQKQCPASFPTLGAGCAPSTAAAWT